MLCIAKFVPELNAARPSATALEAIRRIRDKPGRLYDFDPKSQRSPRQAHFNGRINLFFHCGVFVIFGNLLQQSVPPSLLAHIDALSLDAFRAVQGKFWETTNHEYTRMDTKMDKKGNDRPPASVALRAGIHG